MARDHRSRREQPGDRQRRAAKRDRVLAQVSLDDLDPAERQVQGLASRGLADPGQQFVAQRLFWAWASTFLTDGGTATMRVWTPLLYGLE